MGYVKLSIKSSSTLNYYAYVQFEDAMIVSTISTSSLNLNLLFGEQIKIDLTGETSSNSKYSI